MKTHAPNSKNTKIAIFENMISHINDTLIRIEHIIATDHQKIRDQIKKLHNRIWTNFYWALTAFSILLGDILAKLLHWI